MADFLKVSNLCIGIKPQLPKLNQHKQTAHSLEKTANDPTHLLVEDLNFKLEPYQTLALVGESGSGKSLTALAMARLLPANLQITGNIEFKNRQMLDLNDAQMQKIRGNEIGYVFQEPMLSLNPLHTIGAQIAETLSLHLKLSNTAKQAKVKELLAQVGLEKIAPNRYPHELSGGQKQRVMIAMSIACNPDLLILDEPTTALDASIQLQILELLKHLQKKLSMSMIFISHDLNVVKKMADDILVMRHGKMCEHAEKSKIFNAPQHAYTKLLLDAIATKPKHLEAPKSDVILSTQNLKVEVLRRAHWFKANEMSAILQNANLQIQAGETLGVVGESGSGKTTLALAILNLISNSGGLSYKKAEIKQNDKTLWRSLRKELQIVFQDPFSALSPRMSAYDIIAEGLNLHFPLLSIEEKKTRVLSVISEVGLTEADLVRYPHEFSGGQRQRINIARALILNPKFLVLDEPTSALDVVLQQKMISLLLDLQKKYQLTYLFISHDLKVIRALSHHIMVLKNGEIVEYGESNQVLESPQHEYTKALIKASFIEA